MIVKMNKVTLFVRQQDRDMVLNDLRRLGVLHVQAVQNPVAEDIDRLERSMRETVRALEIIGGDENPPHESGAPADKEGVAGSADGSKRVERALALADEKQELAREKEEIAEPLAWFESWGEVSLATLQSLSDAGIHVRFYPIVRSELKRFQDRTDLFPVREDKATIQLVQITDDADDVLDLKQDPMPPVEIKEVRNRISEIDARIAEIEGTLKSLRPERHTIERCLAGLEKKLEMIRVRHGMGEEERFAYLQGYCPDRQTDGIVKLATAHGCGYVIAEPDDPEKVPTLIEKPRWLKIIDPLFDFMGTLPGYTEHDISFWFLLFFSLFFAILIGDAGYGLVFILLTLWARRKNPQAPPQPYILMYLLGGCTVVWGLITGTWFGFEKIARLPILNSVIIDQIYSYANENQLFLMYFCFIIGVVHLSIAHALVGLKIINSPRALGQLGWILILWTLFFVAGGLVLARPMPDFTLTLFIAGVLLALFFSNYQKNIFKGALQSLSDLPMSIISSFSDVVSYLRLFAVGYATVTVAMSFNGMAAQSGFGSVLAGVVSAFILFFGHGLNIILGLMSVVVHGIRLNMLEFSGHVDMQWSGKEYKPLKD